MAVDSKQPGKTPPLTTSVNSHQLVCVVAARWLTCSHLALAWFRLDGRQPHLIKVAPRLEKLIGELQRQHLDGTELRAVK